MMRTSGLSVAVLLLALPAAGVAQTPGDLDPAFGTGGVARIDVGVGGQARHNVATGVAVQPDGKIVLGGAAIRLPGDGGEERMAAVRLTPSGALDTSFGTGGRVRVDAFPGDGASYYYGRVAVGPGGEIYLHNGAYLGAIGWVTAKLHPGGALATGFGDGGFVGYLSDYVSPADVAVQPDGKLLVLSDYNDEGGMPINQEVLVQRYLSDGTPDASFGDGGYRVIGFNQGDSWEDYAHAMVLQRDGKVVVAAQADVGATGGWDFAVARLTPDGQFDPTFSGNGMVTIGFDLSIGANDVPYALAVDARGRILVGGVAGSEAALARLLPNGTLDPSFSGDGKATFHFASAEPGAYDQIFGLTVQGDGAVIAVGRGTTPAGGSRRFGVARLTSAGALDTGFAGDGTRVFDFSQNSGALSVARAVALLEDGSILAAGGTELALDDMAFVAARLHNDYIFADGFDLASTAAWSSALP